MSDLHLEHLEDIRSLADRETGRDRLHALALERADNGVLRLTPFFGHTAPAGTSPLQPGHWVFSQWWAQPFTYAGETWATAEHAMMASKAQLFGDRGALAKVRAAATPKAAKAIGRQVVGFDDVTWNAHRYGIVLAISAAKFSDPTQPASAAMGAYLTGTRGTLLVEASPYDRIWGIGLRANHPDAAHPRTWRGLNLLGYALTQVRSTLTTP